MYVSNSLSEAVGWEMCNVNVRCSQNTKLTCVCVWGGCLSISVCACELGGGGGDSVWVC